MMVMGRKLAYGGSQVAGSRLGIALILCSAFLVYSRAASPQNVPDLSLQQELERLGAAADALEHTLPSFSCRETGSSDWVVNGKVKRHYSFTSTLRARRTADGQLAESSEPLTLNGKPFSGSDFNVPFYVTGGFDRAMRYFVPSRQACYRYSISPGRIDFETAPDVAKHEQCTNEGLRGFALLDADGNVLHLERHVSEKAAQNFSLAPFASIDFAAVDLNGRTFRLSRHMLSELPEGHNTARFDVTYSDCRLYTATVTIHPATEGKPETDPTAP
jgi:hypothetical protein